LRVTPAQGKIFTLNAAQRDAVRKIPGVAYYDEILEETALLRNDDNQQVAWLRGVSNDYIRHIRFDTLVHTKDDDGRCLVQRSDTMNVFAVAGRGLADRLGIGFRKGTPMPLINVYIAKPDADFSFDLGAALTDNEDVFEKGYVYVSGAYRISDDFDSKYIVVPIAFARKMLHQSEGASSAEIGVKPGASIDSVSAAVATTLGPTVVVKNRFQQNELLFRTLQSEKLWTFIILLFILIIATFNIMGSLTMLILEKKKDIGVLWSMGADRRLIRQIFFTEGVLISLVGVVIGVTLGLVACWLQQKFGFIRFGEGFVVDAYPVSMKFSDVLWIIVSVMTIGLLAAWYPVTIFTRKYLTVKL
jgi:lipoprotein-releasing system permease protein